MKLKNTIIKIKKKKLVELGGDKIEVTPKCKKIKPAEKYFLKV